MLYHTYLDTIPLKDDPKFCPFCHPRKNPNRIFKKSLKSYLTYALAPYHKHHLLVVPKRHVTSLLKLTAAETKDISSLCEYGVRLIHTLGYENCTVLVRDGTDANKSIRHLHYHIIPNTRIGDIDHTGNQRTIMKTPEIRRLIKEVESAKKKIKK